MSGGGGAQASPPLCVSIRKTMVMASTSASPVPALLSLGLRPFFLSAGLFAAMPASARARSSDLIA